MGVLNVRVEMMGVLNVHDEGIGSVNVVKFIGIDGRDVIVAVVFGADDEAYLSVGGKPGLRLTTKIKENP